MPTTILKIMFVGAHLEARLPFEHLAATNENIVGLFTLTPEALGRMSGGIDLTGLAKAANIPVRTGTNLNAPETLAWVKTLAPDLLLVVGWTQLLKSELLAIPRIGCLGFHASLLPKYRGRAPVNWAILNGETETGNTMMVLEPGADEGDIVSQRRIPIGEQDDCKTIYEKVSLTECEMLDEVLPLIREGRLPRVKQDSGAATVMPKRKPEDGLLDWRWPSRRLYNWVRALTHPYPGAFGYLCGRKVTIWKACLDANSRPIDEPAGSVHLSSDGFPLVNAGDNGALKLLQVEREGHSSVSGVEAGQTFLKPPAAFQTDLVEVAV